MVAKITEFKGAYRLPAQNELINKTKRKLIQQSMSKHDGMSVSYVYVLLLANRHQVHSDQVRNLLTLMGYDVEGPPEKPSQEPKPKVQPGPGVPTEVISMILRGGIYKKLGDDPEADPSTVFVVTTLDKFQKEREAIRKLLQGK